MTAGMLPMLQAVIEGLVQILFEVVCGLTGHGLLWVLTLGRVKWSNGRDDLAMFVGLLFWVGLGAGLFFFFLAV